MAHILRLSGHHDRQGFDCGNAALKQWLATVASQHRKKGISTTFVATETLASPAIHGFYSISIAELRSDEFPPAWKKKYPLKVPAFRIGRLAVSRVQQGSGLGGLLLAHALARLEQLAQDVGGIGVLVDAKPEALAFYQRYGFEPLADHPLQLFMPFR